MTTDPQLATATFAAGCFWCTEAMFSRLKGVATVTSGYAGGERPNPTYEEVSTGRSGHAEAIQITFNPAELPYDELLDVFWKTHDPTTLNQQGNDIGPQYRSAIFYHTPEQQQQAAASKARLEEANVYDHPIVTELVPYTNFYPAEDDHQDFYRQNPQHGYCQLVIAPKMKKLEHDFKDKITPE